jgi:hypothetical protein
MATTKKPRKPRGDSKLDSLPADKKAELIDGLVCGWTYRQAADWLQAECGCSVSGSAWTPFFERHVEPILNDIRNFAKMSALKLAREMEDEDIFEKATIREFQENAYQLMRTPGADPEEKRKWMETVLKKMAGVRDDRKVAMLEKKAAQADEAAGVANNTKLSPEEKAAELKRIFRMG